MRLESAFAAALFLGLVPACSAERRTQEAVTAPLGAVVPVASTLAPPPGTLPSPTSSSPHPIPGPYNVILLSIDALRADMPWAGYPRPIAPNLTRFASECVQYTHHYALSSYTSMSLGALLASRYPSELKRDGFFFGVYATDNVFFPELLAQQGVHTLAAQAHGYFKSAGFEQGFRVWEMVPNLKWNNTTDENTTSEVHEAIAEKLLSDPELQSSPFFAWFHFLDPHDKYLSHEGIQYGPLARDRYDAEVTYTDRYVGKLLDFIAMQAWHERTVVIVTADHGESFGEHGHFLHGFELWEQLVHVPLLVRIPGIAPRKIDTARSAIDLAPTIVDLLGVPPHEGFRGKSLVREVRGVEPPEERDVLIDLPVTSDNDLRRALLHDGKKIIRFAQGGTRVFDLASDPGEVRPMAGAEREKMVTRLREAEEKLQEIPPTTCKEGCLNRAYMKK